MSKTASKINFFGTMGILGPCLRYMVPFIVLMAMACEQAPSTPPAEKLPAYKGTIVALGDSLTAGLGVPEEEAYPARLEKKTDR